MLPSHNNKAIGVITIFAGLIAFLSLMLSAIAVNYHFEAFNNPSLILTLPGVDAEAGKWSMICDMLGYYMLLLPLIFYVHSWLKNQSFWSQVITYCGLAYVLIGSIGASVLAVTWPAALHAYHFAAPAEQQIIKANFDVVNTMVYNGMWNLLEQLFAGIWWLASGYFLFTKYYKGVAVAAILTGLSSLLDSLSGMIDNAALHQLSLTVYLYMAVIWAIWMGIVIYRRPLKHSHTGHVAGLLPLCNEENQ